MAYQFTQTGAEIQDILDLAQLQIAAPYDSASSYTAGDYCTKDDGFYVCTASTSGTWDASKWSAVTVGDVLETANANISSLNATLTQLTPSSGTWTPTMPRASIASASGKWQAIGSIVFLEGLISFNSSQSNQGNVFIEEASLPTVARGKAIGGSGTTGNYGITLATGSVNDNVWLSADGHGRFNAQQLDIPSGSLQFAAIALPK